MVIVAGCGDAGDVGTDGEAADRSEPTTSLTASPDPAPGSACLDTPTTGESTVMVDFVDFVQLDAVQYVAGGVGVKAPPVADDQLGDVVGQVECELSILRFREQPGPTVDGDAGFLPVGTEIHAVKGYASSCRVVARIDGENRVYLAQATGGQVSKAVPCAR